MSLNIRPILHALLRNRTGALLVALQIAIALGVLVNAIYIVKQRADRIGRPTGMDVDNIFAISTTAFTSRYNFDASVREDLEYLRHLDGVVAASQSNAVPLSGSGSQEGLATDPNQKAGLPYFDQFEADEQLLDTLGVRLIAGRHFRADEILPPSAPATLRPVSQIIVTRSAANYLFPGQNALGKTLYSLGMPITIIGITENMHGSFTSMDPPDHVVFVPRLARNYGFVYLVRTQPGRRDALMRLAEEHLSASNPDRVVSWVRSMAMLKAGNYRADRNMEIFLVTVTVLLLAVSCLGIFGLSTFNVSTRTRQIGTRRAVGARRRDIVNYFMIENGLITTAGILVGCLLALGIGYWLSRQYNLPRLDLYYLIAGVLLLWSIGQFAAWQPARRAAAVPPSVATRTV